ncbi:MAG TPA: hypothetical protein PKD78_14125, partial [Saprospiraceae bacterium]|nr:hypothetical protein [Saprospiraceae bacterium]
PDAYGFSPTHQVFFLARDTVSHDFVSSSSMYANASTIINSGTGFLLNADKTSDTLKCSYAVGDTFFVMLVNKGDGNQNYRFVNIRYAQSSAQSISVDTFKNAATSIIEKFTSGGSLNNVVFTTDISGLDPLAKDTSIRFRFYSSIPWKTKFYPDKPTWVTALSPSTSAAAGNLFAPEIKVSFPKNPAPKPRRVLIKFTSAAYPEFVYLYVPLEQGPDCILSPKVNIQASASAVCLGDTVRLKAVVTDENGLDVSDAFTYTWSGGLKGQTIRDTLNSLIAKTYTVTASGQYCREASTSTSTSVSVRNLPPAPAPLAGLTDRAACLGNSAALTVTHNSPATTDIIWVENPSSTSSILTGNAYTPPPPVLVGDYTFYARAKSKTGSPVCYSLAIPATLSIQPLPSFQIVDKLCAPALETTYSFKVATAPGNSVSVLSGTGTVEPAPGGGYTVSGIPKGTDITIRIADGTPQACHRDTLIAGLPCNCQAPPKPV